MNCDNCGWCFIEQKYYVCGYSEKNLPSFHDNVCEAWKPKKVTNFDNIKAMSPEELSKWYFDEFFPKAPYCNKTDCNDESPCEECLCDWLRQDVTP